MIFKCDACAVYLALCMSQDIIGVCLLPLNDAVLDESRSFIVERVT